MATVLDVAKRFETFRDPVLPGNILAALFFLVLTIGTLVRRARHFDTQRLAQPAVIEWSGFELVESVAQPGGATYRPLKQ